MAAHKRDIRTFEGFHKNGMLEFSIKLMENSNSDKEAKENLQVLEYSKEVINDTSFSSAVKSKYLTIVEDTIKKVKKSRGWV